MGGGYSFVPASNGKLRTKIFSILECYHHHRESPTGGLDTRFIIRTFFKRGDTAKLLLDFFLILFSFPRSSSLS